ncbi:hypothetical protein [Rhodococcus sp. IEGM 1318]|uniref:5'-methylthioadenosine/S-adenosylhomocysteine nucleosidase family protein n=1 Tax=Rhodococcus sp. IEGM 1318 TaxID=3082226 RepID=UPI002953A5E6|nr:hypothetical protein [Rhodococcus sp. IEGM 1318]MDV8004304.1 hypothetical protein [Rhodococcus sp. IEGM 1318]
MAVLTVIPEEMDAVIAVLGADREAGYTGAMTSAAALCSGLDALPFVVARCDERSNGPAGSSARQLLESWRPETIILTGIAGGIRRTESDPTGGIKLDDGPELGDVVIAEMIHFGDYGKDLPSGFLPRWFPLVHPPTSLVRRHTEALRLTTNWANELADQRPDSTGVPKVWTGELVAVEAVAGNPFAPRQQAILNYFDKAIAIDMESMGVARMLHDYEADVGVHYHPRWLCIRGISDLVVGSDDAVALLDEGDNNAQRTQWKGYSAHTAALVTKIILDRLLQQPLPPYPAQPGVPPWNASASPSIDRVGP